MTKTEFLIVGQGISGTFVSWYLHRAQRSFVVVDDNNVNTPSRVAAGIINPVTGRRVVRTWMIEEQMPFAFDAYTEMGSMLGVDAINEKKIIDFFPTVQMKMAFEKKINEGEDLISLPADEYDYLDSFNYELGYGIVNKGYIVNLGAILKTWRRFLQEQNLLIEQRVTNETLRIEQNGISFDNISADKVIVCDGIYSSINPYFRNLPFALNKGEALIIESDTIPDDGIYKKSLTVAPVGNKLFWVGSSHEWDFIDDQPSEQFLKQTTATLSHWLKHPFKVVDRLAAIRPATVERRPFVGMHPHMPSLGLLNGMGTKGCSLAPYFANQLVDHLTKNTPILPEADISRFSRILQTTS